MNRSQRFAQRGTTLIELTVAMAVTAIGAGIALPGYEQLRQRSHLEGVAAELATHIHYARSLAVERQATLRVSFDPKTESCYVVHSGDIGSCSCSAAGPVCQVGAEAFATQRLDPSHPVTFKANVGSMGIDSDHGTVTPTSTIGVQNRRGERLNVVVNIMGRVRTCEVGASSRGYPKC